MIVCTAVTARDQRELVIRESWLCIIKGLCFSHYFIFIPLTDKRNSQIYKVKQFDCIKIRDGYRNPVFNWSRG